MTATNEKFGPKENLRKAHAAQAAKVQPVCRTCHSPKIERRLIQTWNNKFMGWDTEELDTEFYCYLCEAAGSEVIEEKECGKYLIEERTFMGTYKTRPNLNESPDGTYYQFEQKEVWGPDGNLWPHIKPNQVWTIVQAEENEYAYAGSKWVNRISYVITEEEWVTGSEICLWLDRSEYRDGRDDD